MDEQNPGNRSVTDIPDGTAAPEDPASAVRRELDRLPELDDLPVADHVERFESLHTVLAGALSRVDRV